MSIRNQMKALEEQNKTIMQILESLKPTQEKIPEPEVFLPEPEAPKVDYFQPWVRFQSDLTARRVSLRDGVAAELVRIFTTSDEGMCFSNDTLADIISEGYSDKKDLLQIAAIIDNWLGSMVDTISNKNPKEYATRGDKGTGKSAPPWIINKKDGTPFQKKRIALPNILED